MTSYNCGEMDTYNCGEMAIIVEKTHKRLWILKSRPLTTPTFIVRLQSSRFSPSLRPLSSSLTGCHGNCSLWPTSWRLINKKDFQRQRGKGFASPLHNGFTLHLLAILTFLTPISPSLSLSGGCGLLRPVEVGILRPALEVGVVEADPAEPFTGLALFLLGVWAGSSSRPLELFCRFFGVGLSAAARPPAGELVGLKNEKSVEDCSGTPLRFILSRPHLLARSQPRGCLRIFRGNLAEESKVAGACAVSQRTTCMCVR